MHNIFRSTLFLSVLIGCFCARPVIAGGEILVELSSSYPTIRETKTADIPNLINSADSSTSVKLLKVYCNREDCKLSEEAKDTFVKLAACHPSPTLEILVKDAVEQKEPDQELLAFITPFAKGRLEGALESATRRENTSLVRTFLKEIQKYPDKNAPLKVLTSLEVAIKKNNRELVKLFVESTFDPLAPLPKSRLNALDFACKQNAVEAAEALIPLYSDEYLDKTYANFAEQNPKIASLETIKRTIPHHDVTVPDSHWAAWGIGIAAVGTIAALIARRLVLQK